MEVWKAIPGYEGAYEVSNHGRVKSLVGWIVKKGKVARERIIQPTDNGAGYKIVGLVRNGHRKNYYVHRLVADAFLCEHNGDVVNHKDYNKANNSADNLEWCTQKENVLHSVPKMMHRKGKAASNTGEQYISKQKKNGLYRVTIDQKQIGTFKTLEEAVMARDREMEAKCEQINTQR